MRWWRLSSPDYNLGQWQNQPYNWGARSSLFKPDDKAACQLQYTNYTDKNKIDNEWRTDKRGTNSPTHGTFICPTCDTRDLVLPWQNILRIDHYPLSRESATELAPNTYILPFQSLSGFQKRRFEPMTRSWKIPKYMIKPLAHAGTQVWYWYPN